MIPYVGKDNHIYQQSDDGKQVAHLACWCNTTGHPQERQIQVLRRLIEAEMLLGKTELVGKPLRVFFPKK